MKPSNLLEKDFKIIEKKKTFFLIPVIVVILALIAGTIYGFVFGSPFNLGMDFTGGYSLQVKLYSKLTDETYDSYVEQVENIFENLADENGNKYGLSVSATQLQGAGESAALYVKYQAVKAAKDVDVEALMDDEINVKLFEALTELFKIAPEKVEYDEGAGAVKATYPEIISDRVFEDIKAGVLEKVALVSAGDIKLGADKKTVTVTAAANADLDAFKAALSIDDIFSGRAIKGDTVSATISGELLTDAILAVVAAIVMMLIYIVFRFELSSGIASIVGSFHDIIVMFAFIVIFHIEINATFIASLITILGYSINNTIIIFDRIRENLKLLKNKDMSPTWIANTSVRETVMRSINTTVTTLITIAMVAIIGVPSIRVFALPIILGLIAGTYSSIFVSPAIWASWKEAAAKRITGEKKEKKKKASESV